ncbi:hypothetical protein IWW51_000600 [Coemansia sp. RSA 2702]|nr:hypothetical protein IWW51_000600 [Coemansia sp. RSA 2702]
MSHLTSKSIGPLPIASDHSLYIFTLVIFIVSAWVSLMAFFYGLLVAFIVRIIGSFIDINADFGCRVVIFLNNVFSILPVNLCIYCVVYLELVIIHNISPKKRWPRVVALTLATVCSVIPTSVVLYLPASIVDVDSYCHASRVTNPRQYVYTIIGILSVAILGFHAIQTRNKSHSELPVFQFNLDTSARPVAPSKRVQTTSGE